MLLKVRDFALVTLAGRLSQTHFLGSWCSRAGSCRGMLTATFASSRDPCCCEVLVPS